MQPEIQEYGVDANAVMDTQGNCKNQGKKG